VSDLGLMRDAGTRTTPRVVTTAPHTTRQAPLAFHLRDLEPRIARVLCRGLCTIWLRPTRWRCPHSTRIQPSRIHPLSPNAVCLEIRHGNVSSEAHVIASRLPQASARLAAKQPRTCHPPRDCPTSRALRRSETYTTIRSVGVGYCISIHMKG
jgi:hypothetical protein